MNPRTAPRAVLGLPDPPGLPFGSSLELPQGIYFKGDEGRSRNWVQAKNASTDSSPLSFSLPHDCQTANSCIWQCIDIQGMKQARGWALEPGNLEGGFWGRYWGILGASPPILAYWSPQNPTSGFPGSCPPLACSSLEY